MTALVVYLQNTLARLRERQEGQTMAEYALILGGIAVVVIAGILILGPRDHATSSSRPAARSRPSRARSSIFYRSAAGPSIMPTTFGRMIACRPFSTAPSSDLTQRCGPSVERSRHERTATPAWLRTRQV